jgi:hypothetical protein
VVRARHERRPDHPQHVGAIDDGSGRLRHASRIARAHDASPA